MHANEYYLKEIGRHLKKLADEKPTLRDRYAIAVLPAILPAGHIDEWVLPRVATLAYNIADAMMEARGK